MCCYISGGTVDIEAQLNRHENTKQVHVLLCGSLDIYDVVDLIRQGSAFELLDVASSRSLQKTYGSVRMLSMRLMTQYSGSRSSVLLMLDAHKLLDEGSSYIT